MALVRNSKPDRLDRRYISAAMAAPLLEREVEVNLARRWRDHKDCGALNQIITSHIRLVVRIASSFRGYGLPMTDLIQEGNIGLLEAANRFDPEREVRFSTYASWWIMAAIQEYIVRNSSIVRVGTTPAQKSLFFNLRRLRAKVSTNPSAPMTDGERRQIAEILHVPLEAVERMEAHLSGPDRSLNATIGDDDVDSLQDFLADPSPTPEEVVTDRHDREIRAKWLREAMNELNPRERAIVAQRFLGDGRTTLADIGDEFGVTKERIRQIEGKALQKLRAMMDRRIEGPATRAG